MYIHNLGRTDHQTLRQGP